MREVPDKQCLPRGRAQEQQAADFLQRQGLVLLETNFSCRLGEIDLIMQDGGSLVFVEVRYRRSSRFGSAVETVGPRKQQRLRRCAGFFLKISGLGNALPCRFDIVGMTTGRNGEPTFEWIRDAFM